MAGQQSLSCIELIKQRYAMALNDDAKCQPPPSKRQKETPYFWSNLTEYFIENHEIITAIFKDSKGKRQYDVWLDDTHASLDPADIGIKETNK